MTIFCCYSQSLFSSLKMLAQLDSSPYQFVPAQSHLIYHYLDYLTSSFKFQLLINLENQMLIVPANLVDSSQTLARIATLLYALDAINGIVLVIDQPYCDREKLTVKPLNDMPENPHSSDLSKIVQLIEDGNQEQAELSYQSRPIVFDSFPCWTNSQANLTYPPNHSLASLVRYLRGQLESHALHICYLPEQAAVNTKLSHYEANNKLHAALSSLSKNFDDHKTSLSHNQEKQLSLQLLKLQKKFTISLSEILKLKDLALYYWAKNKVLPDFSFVQSYLEACALCRAADTSSTANDQT